MNKNIIKALFSLLPKGDKVWDMGKEAYNIYKDKTIKKIEIVNILEMADKQEIKIGESFIVKGFVSAIAPINEPETYMEKVCRFKEGANNTTIVTIKPYPLPISKYIVEDEKVIAFLYVSAVESIFEFDCDYIEDKIIVNERNKFIPIIIDVKLINQVINEEVEMKVKIKEINSKKALQLYEYKDNKFNELTELFYDPYNMNINSIVLELEEIVKVLNEKIYLGEHAFGVEYKLSEYDCKDIEMHLAKACEKVTLKSLRLKMLGIGVKNIIPCEKDIFIHIKNNYIGFYIKIDTNNRNLYRNKIKELKTVTNKVLNELKMIGKVEINFISDEEKIKLFK